MVGNNVGGLNNAFNSPLVLSVRHDSVHSFFRALPEKIEQPTDLPRQINAESLVSAELQRVFSAFRVMLGRLERDQRAGGYVPKLVFRRTMESTESNHFAKKI